MHINSNYLNSIQVIYLKNKFKINFSIAECDD